MSEKTGSSGRPDRGRDDYWDRWSPGFDTVVRSQRFRARLGLHPPPCLSVWGSTHDPGHPLLRLQKKSVMKGPPVRTDWLKLRPPRRIRRRNPPS